MRGVLVVALAVVATGCSDRFQEGYAAGYAAGEASARAREQARRDEEIRERERSSYVAPPVVSTTVCGGAGIVVNGKHVPGGKTGCVRAYSDGTVQRY